VFGNGKTALKVNFGKYLEPTSNNNNYILSNPITRIATTTTRSWTDANGNFVPDCVLTSPALNGECGPMSANTFGTTALTTAAIDPKILEGWSVRSNDWQIGASIQQQILPRLSIEAGYLHRWLNNFTVTDNCGWPGRLPPYSIGALRPRLPGGGGYLSTGCWRHAGSSARRAQHHAGGDFGEQYQRAPTGSWSTSAEARSGRAVPGRDQHGQDRAGQLRRARATARAADRRARPHPRSRG
jgi:hypothetical protein